MPSARRAVINSNSGAAVLQRHKGAVYVLVVYGVEQHLLFRNTVLFSEENSGLEKRPASTEANIDQRGLKLQNGLRESSAALIATRLLGST